jgi:DNA-binding MarR family transcriptional regulator
MAQQGMIIRHADPRDGRRVFVELAPEVSSALRQYFVNVIQTQTARDQSSRAAA